MPSSKTPLVFAALAVLAAPTAAVADSDFYIGVSAGGASFETSPENFDFPSIPGEIDEDDTAFKVYGGFDFDLPVIDLGVELGYVDLGAPEAGSGPGALTLDTTGFNAWGIASIDVALIDVYAKLGFIAWEIDAQLLDESLPEDGTDLGYGIGAAFELGPVEVRGEFELYDLDDTDVSMLSLGVLYRF